MSRLTPWQIVLALLALYSSTGIAAESSSPITTAVTAAGSVAQPLSLSVADLKRYPAHEIDYAPGRGGEQQSSGEPGADTRDASCATSWPPPSRSKISRANCVKAMLWRPPAMDMRSCFRGRGCLFRL
jgi:hypothetical protein